MPDGPDTRALLDELMAAEGVRRYGARQGRPAEAPAVAPAVAQAVALAEAPPPPQELETLRSQLAALQRERDQVDAERRALARQLARRQDAVLPPPPPGLRAALVGRGLPPDEHARALAQLLLEQPEATLAALEQPESIPALLDERLVLACAGPCRTLAGRAVVLTVSPERCERCGGSDTAAAWRRFAEACAAAGVRRIVILGGSPAYRQQLGQLAAGSGPRLELVDGKAKPRARRVKSQARTADLVVIWGATIVDHATTNAFEATGARTLRVPHRGIGTMLRWLAEQLPGSGAR